MAFAPFPHRSCVQLLAVLFQHRILGVGLSGRQRVFVPELLHSSRHWSRSRSRRRPCELARAQGQADPLASWIRSSVVAEPISVGVHGPRARLHRCDQSLSQKRNVFSHTLTATTTRSIDSQGRGERLRGGRRVYHITNRYSRDRQLCSSIPAFLHWPSERIGAT